MRHTVPSPFPPRFSVASSPVLSLSWGSWSSSCDFWKKRQLPLSSLVEFADAKQVDAFLLSGCYCSGFDGARYAEDFAGRRAGNALGHRSRPEPMIVPTRGHLGSTRRPMQGYFYFSTGSRQRSLEKNRLLQRQQGCIAWRKPSDIHVRRPPGV